MTQTRLLTLSGVALAIALAFVSNPTAQKHRDAIRTAVKDRSPVAGALGVGALTAFTSTYQSWGVCSFTTVNDRTISIGAFGIVHVRDVVLSGGK
jgi:heme O synthase-like polyprenyltransferase